MAEPRSDWDCPSTGWAMFTVMARARARRLPCDCIVGVRSEPRGRGIALSLILGHFLTISQRVGTQGRSASVPLPRFLSDAPHQVRLSTRQGGQLLLERPKRKSIIG